MIFNPRKSTFRKYQELVIGNYNLMSLLKFELITTNLSWIPGALGIILRKHFYKCLFKEKGTNVIFGQNVGIACPSKIKIGKNCLISDNCLLDAEVESGGISIGDNVQIARGALLRSRSKGGSIEIGDNTSVGSYCNISSIGTRVKVGKGVLIASYCCIIGGGVYGFDRLDIQTKVQVKHGKGIIIEDNVWLGARICVLDGNRIGTGSVIGAGSVVTKDIPEYSTAVGVPAKVIKKRI